MQSKIGSLDNVKHKPGGGDKKIFDDKEYLKQMSGMTSKAGSEGIPSGTQVTSSQSPKHRHWLSLDTLAHVVNIEDKVMKEQSKSETSLNTNEACLLTDGPLKSANVDSSPSKDDYLENKPLISADVISDGKIFENDNLKAPENPL